jgi:type IV secretory pathway VirB2 component (pilin)
MLNPQAGALVGASNWAEGMLTGTIAIGLAVVAVAGFGFQLLTGRLELRRAAQVVLGVFILFSAPTLARELTAALRGTGAARSDLSGAPADLPPPPKAPSGDSYAGAAVPPS